ncbi:hypothetical protein GJAV_G00024440 [Gymnothorax javanicus]|nr:hypothetical protein GJAV_G00024440 [Gymnothorax javanicus]
MLPSAGFFDKINCPFFQLGFCERPFCHYKHAKDERLLTTSRSTRFAREVGTARNHWTSTKVTSHQNRDVQFEKDPCLLELERINKEIETVKCEVEKEQRRLSHYKSLQGESDGSKQGLIPYNDTGGRPRKPITRNISHQQKSSNARSLVGKYVVDSSKPRTDLEYDPLSNYTADVRSSSSAERNPVPFDNGEEKPSLKRPRENENEGRNEFPSTELEDSDDGVLIIDIPPLEIKRKARRPVKLSKTLPEIEENAVPAAPEADNLVPSQSCEAVASMPDFSDAQSESNCAETSVSLVINEGSECEQKHNPSVLEDISKCLETLRHESEKIPPLPKMEVVQTTKSSSASESNTLNTVAWSAKDKSSEPNGNSCSMVPPVIKHELLHSCDPKSNSPLSTRQVSVPESDQSIPPSSLKSQSNIQSNNQPGTSVVQGYWVPVHQVPLPCLQKTVPQTSGSDISQFHCVPSADPSLKRDPESTSGIGPISSLQGASRSGGAQHLTNEVDLRGISKDPQIHTVSESDAKTEMSSGDELNYSDMDLSDSDPMEECYRIFMEANQEGREPADQPESSSVEMSDLEKTGLEKTPVVLSGPKKRVAHVNKHEVNKNRPQVIVPLRGPGSHLSNPSRIQQLQQKATELTAGIKGGQAYAAASAGAKKPVTVVPVSHHIPVQSTYFNIIPVGATIQLDSNVHFIIPDRNMALPITPVPSQVVSPQQTAVTSAKAQTCASRIVSAQPLPVRRKPKSRPEPSVKVPHDVRQRYVNLFVEEFLKTSSTVQDAFEKALAEEKMVFERSVNKLKYLSVAVNALKRLKHQNIPSVKASTGVNEQGSRGKICLIPLGLQTNDPGVAALYEQMKEHVLSEAALKEYGFPLQSPEKPGSAVLYGEVKKGSTDPMKRICCRCGATFSVSQSGKHVRKEECNYHYGRVVENRVPGGAETRYTCCEGAIGTPGCQVYKLHVHDAVSLDGFVMSLPKPHPETGCPGVFALDCDTCYTTQGLELARVTVVNTSLQVIYDAFVKPDNEVIDYNTRFSGLSEEDLKGSTSSIRDVQEILLSFVSEDTILIGHSLEKDLCALKLLHSSVVDLTAVFPHRLGLPHKRGLRSLTADYLMRIIQESVEGHDSREDATACMELMLLKVKEDAKVKRW